MYDTSNYNIRNNLIQDKVCTSHVLPEGHHLHNAFHQDPVELKEHITVYRKTVLTHKCQIQPLGKVRNTRHLLLQIKVSVKQSIIFTVMICCNRTIVLNTAGIYSM